MKLAILLAIFLLGLVIRLWGLGDNARLFQDQGWYVTSAILAREGQIQLSGITSSITWLHQGVVWTYLLVPVVKLSPISGHILSAILDSLLVPVIFVLVRKYQSSWAGLFASLAWAANPWAVANGRLGYHTSVIPLFTGLFLFFTLARRSFLAGLFLGLLYQSQLLTFIFWPVALWALYKGKLTVSRSLLGFGLGLLPFLLQGPLQTFGVFVWVAYKSLTGFGGISGMSDAYLSVILLPSILVLVWIGSKIKELCLRRS